MNDCALASRPAGSPCAAASSWQVTSFALGEREPAADCRCRAGVLAELAKWAVQIWQPTAAQTAFQVLEGPYSRPELRVRDPALAWRPQRSRRLKGPILWRSRRQLWHAGEERAPNRAHANLRYDDRGTPRAPSCF